MSCKSLVVFVILLVLAGGLYADVTTFQELMDPAVFPDAQMGMEVKSVTLKAGILAAETTGAKMRWDLAAGKISFEQLIGHKRVVLDVETTPITVMPTITHTGPGLGFVDFSSPNMELRINGDSLFMIHVHQTVPFVMRKRILPMHRANYGTSCHLLLDEWGGFSLYCSDKNKDVSFNAFSRTVPILEAPTVSDPDKGKVKLWVDGKTATYNMTGDQVLWIGVCPPKPFDWTKSLNDQVIWHWTDYTGYPTNTQLTSWASHGNVYLLQSEVMLWLDWNLAFIPRFGMSEWNRVRDKVHQLGKKYIVYTSPAFFYKDTAFEPYAFNDWDDATAAGMIPQGENIDQFISEITNVMTNLQPDGLYFDGQYFDDIAGTYRLARTGRQLIGDGGVFEWHSTIALGDDWGKLMYIPHADAYVDYMIRGEFNYDNFDNQRYLRYFVSGYNISNIVGCACITDPAYLTSQQGQLLALNNIRLHEVFWWLSYSQFHNDFVNNYKSWLTPMLPGYVESQADQRQEAFKKEWLDVLAERESIETVPTYGTPLFQENFNSVPAWDPCVSPQNPSPFSPYYGNLEINAYAHTYAWLEKVGGLPSHVEAIQVRIRHRTDGGMAWGPAAALWWGRNNYIKIGTRSDGKLFVHINEDEHLLGTFTASNWIYLRARWGKYFGVIESSTDGANWTQQIVFEHIGTYYNESPAKLLIGKIGPQCMPADYSDPGNMGESRYDDLRLY